MMVHALMPISFDFHKERVNLASQYIAKLQKSEFSQAHADLQDAVSNTLGGNCVYLRDFICLERDTTIFRTLKEELLEHASQIQSLDTEKTSTGMINWSRHMRHEDPTFSPTFQSIVAIMKKYFDVDGFASRLNYYPDGTHWKTFHRDSHAYSSATKEVKEDFTIGISLGATRKLSFLHEDTNSKFSFPQRNGDCFAFSSKVNDAFLHGVPMDNAMITERFSIIVWGKRRTLNSRNSVILSKPDASSVENSSQRGQTIQNRVTTAMHRSFAPFSVSPEKNKTAFNTSDLQAKDKRGTRNRLQ